MAKYELPQVTANRTGCKVYTYELHGGGIIHTTAELAVGEVVPDGSNRIVKSCMGACLPNVQPQFGKLGEWKT